MEKKKIIIISSISAAVLAIILTVVLILVISASKKPAGYRSVKAFNITGEVLVERNNKSFSAKEKMNFQNNDVLTTKEDSSITLKLDEDKYVFIKENTVLHLAATGTSKDSKTRLYVEDGGVIVDVKNKISNDSSFEIASSNSVMAIRGTQIEFDVVKNSDASTYDVNMSVIKGLVELTVFAKDSNGEYKFTSIDQASGEKYQITALNSDINASDINKILDGDKDIEKKNNTTEFLDNLVNVTGSMEELTKDEINSVKNIIDEYTTEITVNQWENVLKVENVFEGEEVNPSATAKYGVVSYKYSKDNITFTDEKPNIVGKYYVKAVVLDEAYKLESEERIFYIISKLPTDLKASYGDKASSINSLLPTGWKVVDDNTVFSSTGSTAVVPVIHETGIKGNVSVKIEKAINSWTTTPILSSGSTFTEEIVATGKARFGEMTQELYVFDDVENKYVLLTDDNSSSYSFGGFLKAGKYKIVFNVEGSSDYSELSSELIFNINQSDYILTDKFGNILEKDSNGKYVLNMEYFGNGDIRLLVIYTNYDKYSEMYMDGIDENIEYYLIKEDDLNPGEYIEEDYGGTMPYDTGTYNFHLTIAERQGAFNALDEYLTFNVTEYKTRPLSAYDYSELKQDSNGIYYGIEYNFNNFYSDSSYSNMIYMVEKSGDDALTDVDVTYSATADFAETLTASEIRALGAGTYYLRVKANARAHYSACDFIVKFTLITVEFDDVKVASFLNNLGIEEAAGTYTVEYDENKSYDLTKLLSFVNTNSKLDVETQITYQDNYYNQSELDSLIIKEMGTYRIIVKVIYGVEAKYEYVSDQLTIVIDKMTIDFTDEFKEQLISDGWVLKEGYYEKVSNNDGYELTQEDLASNLTVDLSSSLSTEAFRYDNSSYTNKISKAGYDYQLIVYNPTYKLKVSRFIYKGTAVLNTIDNSNVKNYLNWTNTSDTAGVSSYSGIVGEAQIPNYYLGQKFSLEKLFGVSGNEVPFYDLLDSTNKVLYSTHGVEGAASFEKSIATYFEEAGTYYLKISMNSSMWVMDEVLIEIKIQETATVSFANSNVVLTDYDSEITKDDILALATFNTGYDTSKVTITIYDSLDNEVTSITASDDYTIEFNAVATDKYTSLSKSLTLSVYGARATINWIDTLTIDGNNAAVMDGKLVPDNTADDIVGYLTYNSVDVDVKIFTEEGTEITSIPASSEQVTYIIKVTPINDGGNDYLPEEVTLKLTGTFEA